MGIADLNTFLEKKIGNAHRAFLNVKVFRGKRVAVDGTGWIHQNQYIAFLNELRDMPNPLNDIDFDSVKRRLLVTIVEFINFFMRNGITPIFIWDGEHPPEKAITREERKDQRQKNINRVETLKNELLTFSPLERPGKLIGEYKKALSAILRLDSNIMDDILLFLKNIGIPSIKAPFEGEELCAGLALSNKVMGVFTIDTDAYALGIPIVINGKQRTKDADVFNVGFTDVILDKLKFTQSEFKDFCIMCGTDFNRRIPGKGPSKSFDILKKGDSTIETAIILNKNLDFSVLNLEKTRELLSPAFIEVSDKRININFTKVNENGKDSFAFFGIGDMWDTFKENSQIVEEVGASDYTPE